tara:strand:+ start:53066 stop:53494 length:429 start_codon:yes stop_codon:yes gene_type:complete
VTDGVPKTATWLGRAGLLPFLALPLLIVIDLHHRQLWENALAAYTLAIICFLLGAWWGLALIRRYPLALVLSNVLLLVLFFSYLLLSMQIYFLIAAALFISILVIERRYDLFRLQPAYYSRLRLHLSLAASLALVVVAVLMG